MLGALVGLIVTASAASVEASMPGSPPEKKEQRLSPFVTGRSGTKLSPYVNPAAARSALKNRVQRTGSPRPAVVSGSVPERPAASGPRAASSAGAPAPRPAARPTTTGGASTPAPAPLPDVDAGSVHFSSPQNIDGSAQFSMRPQALMPDPPPPPRERRVGTGWIAGRGASQPQPRPSAPGPITTELGNNGQVTLRWEDLSTNETGFRIEQQVQVGPSWEPGGTYTVGPGREQVLVTIVTGTHRFRVLAFNGGGNSSPSGWSAPLVVDNPEEPDPLPAVPTNVTATDAGNGSVNVHWDDNSANETGFAVERDPAFTGGALRNTAANVQMINDVSGMGTFRYRVRAFNAAGNSEFSPWATIAVADTVPAAPSGLVCADQGNESEVLLTWVDNSSNEDQFIIHRQTQIGAQWLSDVQFTASANATTYMDDPGSGNFRYRIAASNQVGQSSWTSWATVGVTDGWTQFTASADSRIIYVSSSLGNDSNNGLSEQAPKRTIAAGYAQLRHGYPDWMLLRRGDTWVNESLGHWRKSGRSDSEKMVVNTYGPLSQPRPLLQTGTANGFTRTGGNGSPQTIDNIAIVGIRFVPHTRTATAGGNGFSWLDGGSNVLVEDCSFEGYKSNFTVQGYTGTLTNFKVRRCIAIDAYSGDSHSQGMYFSKTTNLLIEGCIVDHNGWRENVANPTIFNHNIYIQPNCQFAVVRNCFVSRASSHGLQLRGGGEAHENVLVANPISLLLGTGGADGGGPDPTFPVIANGSYNVILDGRDMSAGNPRGFGMDVLFASSGDIHHNIFANLSQAGAPRPIHLDGSQGDGNRNLNIHHNIIYNWGGSITFRGDTTTLQDIQFADNVVHTTTGSWPLIEHVAQGSIGEVQHARNRFHSSGSANNWMRIGNTFYAFQAWRDAVDDVGSTAVQVSFPAPSRTVGTYAATVGLAGNLDAYLARVRTLRRGDWPAEFTPEALATYIRQGFGMADP